MSRHCSIPSLEYDYSTLLTKPLLTKLRHLISATSGNDVTFGVQEEMREVEEKLSEKKQTPGVGRRLLLKFCTPVLIEACILTFVAGHAFFTFMRGAEMND